LNSLEFQLKEFSFTISGYYTFPKSIESLTKEYGMKRFLIVALAIGTLSIVSVDCALCQYAADYAYNPAQALYGQQAQSGYGQNYGQYYGNDQANYANYGQNYGQDYGQYGQQYGQNPYNYSDQGYGANAYPYNQYGQQQQQQQQQQPRANRTARKPQNAAPAAQAAQPSSAPYIQTPGGTQQPDRVFQAPGNLTKEEIYWDGQDGQESAPSATQGQPGQVPAPIMRQARPAPGGATPAVNNPIQKKSKREKNALSTTVAVPPPPAKKMQWGKQETTEAIPPAPDRSNVKWGKQETTSFQQESRPAMKWGKQDKPAPINAEPGSFQSSSQGQSNSQVQAESASGKKFQWGKTN
jgi:hypothetical protein